MKIDWDLWNKQYDDKNSGFYQRLIIIKLNILSVFNEFENPNILSICSGRGKDILELIKENNLKYNKVVLVDNDKNSLNFANDYVRKNNLKNIEIKYGNAGHMNIYDGFKCDILIAVGFFGHISPSDIENTISKFNQLINKDSYIIWSGGKPVYKQVISSFEKNNYRVFNVVQGISEKNLGVGISKYLGKTAKYNKNDYLFSLNI